MNKKQKEKTILSLVYKKDEFAEVFDSEMPDFTIKHKYRNVSFGVEITELHQTNADARLKNIPGYFREILDGSGYRHKDDQTILVVRDVTTTSADEKDKGTFRAIVRQLPSIEDYVRMVVQILTNKEEKAKAYQSDLNHINLIILDSVHRTSTASIREFYWYFFTPNLRKALYSSTFREVFFVTILDKERRVYVPLKLLLLLADFYMFGKLVSSPRFAEASNHFDESGNSARDYMLVCAAYMRSKTDRICINNDGENVEWVCPVSTDCLPLSHSTSSQSNLFVL